MSVINPPFLLIIQVYTAYIEGIMSEDDVSLEERIESVLGFLKAATEEDLSSFGEELKALWTAKLNQATQTAAEADAKKGEYMKAQQERLDAEKQVALEEQQRQAEEIFARQQNRAEVRGREALLNKYGFDTDAVDEEGNVIAALNAPTADYELGAMLGSNANKAQVQEAARAQREKAKDEHAKKVAREKELLLKQKMKKEVSDLLSTCLSIGVFNCRSYPFEYFSKDSYKIPCIPTQMEKKRTMKREKQRGCG